MDLNSALAISRTEAVRVSATWVISAEQKEVDSEKKCSISASLVYMYMEFRVIAVPFGPRPCHGGYPCSTCTCHPGNLEHEDRYPKQAH